MRKKWLVYPLVALFLLAALLAGTALLARRERKLAQEVAREEVQRILADPAARAGLSLAAGASLASPRPVDTDLFIKRWTVVFSLRPRGIIQVDVHALRGLPMLPLLNRKGDLRIGQVVSDGKVEWPAP
jgi:hypothetical protein